jgi:hypothetical protein
MANSKEFWESLGVPVDDITEKQTELGERIFQRLARKLENLSGDYFQIVKETFKIDGTSLTAILQALYSSSKPEFLDLFALAMFAEKKVNPEIIYEVASGIMKGSLARRISERTIDSTAVLLPLFKTHPEAIRQIYYEHLLQRSSLKRFVCEPRLSQSLNLNSIDFKKIENLLQMFEKHRSAKLRRPIKLWWFDKDDEKGRIVFRREKNARSELKLVKKNVFQKTGDEKIFVIRDGGSVLEMCSRREPKRTVKVAEFIINKLTGQKVKFLEVFNSYDSEKVSEFITRLKSGEIENASLLSIKVRNVPLTNSPIMELQCSECLVPAIQDLEDNHNLSIMDRAEDILGLRIRLEGRSYNLKTRIEGNEIEIISDNKNLRDPDKQKISKFLAEQIGS